uniref:Cnd1 domain-containing protein n=1 Tax=Heterorhabditis bacteriophora TaxID=37862 RepID=A0A1I7XEV1_HETBA
MSFSGVILTNIQMNDSSSPLSLKDSLEGSSGKSPSQNLRSSCTTFIPNTILDDKPSLGSTPHEKIMNSIYSVPVFKVKQHLLELLMAKPLPTLGLQVHNRDQLNRTRRSSTCLSPKNINKDVSDHSKDYIERRRRNNDSARRSREVRRQREQTNRQKMQVNRNEFKSIMIKIDASSSLGISTILTKKRKYTSDPTFITDQKRVKQDISDTNLNPRRRVAQNVTRRKAVDVLADVLLRLEAGDRQIASHLLREFSIDHLATVSRDLPEIVSLIITSATVTKYDQIASALLRMLLCVMRRADNLLWVSVMSRLLSDDGPESLLFGRISLDDRLLHLLTDGLNRGAMNAATLPVRVLRCSERSLRCSTNASRRAAAIGFQVARTINKRSDSTAFRQLERILCQMTSDRDSRVRIAAVDGLGVLSRREDALTIQTYNIVRNLIGDSDRHVRIEALRILLVFANRNPSSMVTSSHGRDNRLSLCDDSFSMICNAINDPEDSGGNEKVKKVQASIFAISKSSHSVKKEGRWKSKWQKPGSVQQGCFSFSYCLWIQLFLILIIFSIVIHSDTAKLILVLNAAARYSPVVSLLPQYVLKHYRFLRAAMPHLVAPIKCVDSNAVERLAYSNDSELEGSADILQNTYERLRDVYREGTFSDRNLLRRFIIELVEIILYFLYSDAKAICSFNAPLAGSARFLASLIEICSALESTSQIVLCGGDLTDAVYTIQQEIIRVHCAEHQFSGVSSPIASFLIESRLHLSLQALMVSLISTPEMYPHIIQDIRNVIDYANSRWMEIGAPSDMAVSLMSEVLDVLNCEKDDGKKILTPGVIGQLLIRYTPVLPDSFPDIGGIRSKWAQITEPDKDAALEKPIRFVAGLPTAVTFVANLFNLDNNDILKIRVQVDYPDHARTFFRPRISDFNGKQSSVMSKVLLTSAQAWSDSAEVRLTLVLITDSASGPVPVPLLDSPTRANNASVRVRMHPMNRS